MCYRPASDFIGSASLRLRQGRGKLITSRSRLGARIGSYSISSESYWRAMNVMFFPTHRMRRGLVARARKAPCVSQKFLTSLEPLRSDFRRTWWA